MFDNRTEEPTLSPTLTLNPSAIGGIPITRRPTAIDMIVSSSSSSEDKPCKGWGPCWGYDDDDGWRPNWKPNWSKPKPPPPQWKPDWSEPNWSKPKRPQWNSGLRPQQSGQLFKPKSGKRSHTWGNNQPHYETGWSSSSSSSSPDEKHDGGWVSLSSNDNATDISSSSSSSTSEDGWESAGTTWNPWAYHSSGKSGKSGSKVGKQWHDDLNSHDTWSTSNNPWPSWYMSGKSGKSGGADYSNSSWQNVIGGLKPKSGKEGWSSPGKELIYDDADMEAFPSRPSEWSKPINYSSGKSGKSGTSTAGWAPAVNVPQDVHDDSWVWGSAGKPSASDSITGWHPSSGKSGKSGTSNTGWAPAIDKHDDSWVWGSAGKPPVSTTSGDALTKAPVSAPNNGGGSSGSCSVCLNGITVPPLTTVGGTDKTCADVLAQAATVQAGSSVCNALAGAIPTCCPRPPGSCSVCSNGLTVSSSTPVGENDKTCADVLTQAAAVEEGSAVCNALEGAIPTCCPSAVGGPPPPTTSITPNIPEGPTAPGINPPDIDKPTLMPTVSTLMPTATPMVELEIIPIPEEDDLRRPDKGATKSATTEKAAAYQKPSLGAQFLQPGGHHTAVSAHTTKAHRAGPSAKSEKAAHYSNPKQPTPIPHYPSRTSKSAKNSEASVRLAPPVHKEPASLSSTPNEQHQPKLDDTRPPSGPSGTKSDIKYSEGLADGYSGYKQKDGEDFDSSGGKSSASAASTGATRCIIWMSISLALLEYVLI